MKRKLLSLFLVFTMMFSLVIVSAPTPVQATTYYNNAYPLTLHDYYSITLYNTVDECHFYFTAPNVPGTPYTQRTFVFTSSNAIAGLDPYASLFDVNGIHIASHGNTTTHFTISANLYPGQTVQLRAKTLVAPDGTKGKPGGYYGNFTIAVRML